MRFKMTGVIELVGMEAILKSLSLSVFELSSNNRLHMSRLGRLLQYTYSISASEGLRYEVKNEVKKPFKNFYISFYCSFITYSLINHTTTSR